MGKITTWLRRRVLRQNHGWQVIGGSTVIVPPGKWTIVQQITFKDDKVSASEPIIKPEESV